LPTGMPRGSDPRGSGWRGTVRRRALVAAALFAAWAVAIAARLVVLQVVDHAALVERARRQHLRTVTAPARRGQILDRHGRTLAVSADAETIYAVPAEIAEPDRVADALCGALGDCSAAERDALAERLRGSRAFAYVRRQVSPDVAARVAALKLDGVGFLKESRRYYPKRELAAHVLGYVGVDNVGLDGIEAVYNEVVRGRDGRILIQVDARRHALSSWVDRPPTAGDDIELTLDQTLQFAVERELEAAVAEHRAAGGSIVVTDPWTGQILALANWPTFNPNTFQRAPAEARRNRAVQDLYEPGSTFKIVTASAALEERLVRPDEPVDVSAGFIRFGPRQIDDVHRYGVLSFTDVIVKSSNVGAIKVGLRLGAERLARYARRFGFGQTLLPDLGGENPGILWRPEQLTDSALASMAMGYQVGVTAIQMAAAVGAIANGGELVEPRLVRAFVRGGRRVEVPRRVIRRAIGPDTAGLLTTIMEQVVERGTARAARVAGYQVAGKTGTAQKLVGGRYSQRDYIASFVGFAPSRRPAVAIVVVIDSPRAKGYFGGEVAAPVFARVAETALRLLGVGPTINPVPPVLVARREEAEAGAAAPTPVRATEVDASLGRRPIPAGAMPDLRGLSARDALRVLAPLGVTPQLGGEGFVVDQQPAAGAPLDAGAWVWLRLARRAPTSGGTP
jgi:cell division protein FtsI (penicillin-binding protein 3)